MRIILTSFSSPTLAWSPIRWRRSVPSLRRPAAPWTAGRGPSGRRSLTRCSARSPLGRRWRPTAAYPSSGGGAGWGAQLNARPRKIAVWPTLAADDGIPFVDVVRCLHRHAPGDLILCLDAGSFAAPVYRHFPFTFPQRLMASFSGAMGYGTPAAVAAQLRRPAQKVVCLVGDGGFLMTGNEM